MHGQTLGGQSSHDAPAAALTPRPLRLLLVARVIPGSEAGLREVQAKFPHDAAIEAGIEAVEAFIGSGHYAVQLEIGGDDIQHVLATFFNDSRVREFRTALEPMVEGLPGSDYQFGTADRFHPDTPSDANDETTDRTVYNTADLPIAASMYRWRVGEPPQTGKVPQGGGGRT